jgi:hypothetical protein
MLGCHVAARAMLLGHLSYVFKESQHRETGIRNSVVSQISISKFGHLVEAIF